MSDKVFYKKMRPKEKLVIDTPRVYFVVEIDKDGIPIYHTEAKK